MNRSTFTTPPDNRYFEDYVTGVVHEFGSIPVEEHDVLDFGGCKGSCLDVTLNHEPRSITTA
jgi:hypothetical protein